MVENKYSCMHTYIPHTHKYVEIKTDILEESGTTIIEEDPRQSICSLRDSRMLVAWTRANGIIIGPRSKDLKTWENICMSSKIFGTFGCQKTERRVRAEADQETQDVYLPHSREDKGWEDREKHKLL